MSRHKFGGMVADWAFSFNSDGSVSQAGGAVLTFWDSLSGGTQYTAAPMPGGVDDGTGLLDGTGTPVSSVTCDGNGEIPDALQGPDGVYRMAADASGAGTGPRRWLYANDIGADLTTLLADVASLPALGQAPVYVYYNTTTASWPARPSTSSVVWWVGPVSPPVGGTGATGSDVWLNTTGATAPAGVTSVTAADASIVIGGTPSAPTVQTGTLNLVASQHPPVTDWSNANFKITSLGPGVASTDAATVGQVGATAGTLTPTSVKTSGYTAAAGDLVLVSTASGAVTVTLPATPADKTRAGVKTVIAGAGNLVTVSTSGTDRLNVAGGGASLTLTRLFQAVTLQYQASAGLWLVTGTDPAISPAAPATFAPASPAGTTSAAAVMMGLGGICTYTPVSSGIVVAHFGGDATNSVVGVATTVAGAYGTGTAPVNGAASAGTAFGAAHSPKPYTSGAHSPFCEFAVLALTPGTAYWFDLSVSTSNTADTASVSSITCTLAELR